jgi:tetratricopeptide (TPR) repeat protein
VDNSVFISYRRSVSEFVARAVFQDLSAHDINAFVDVESLDAGQFESIIFNQIAARPYFLVVLAPGSLDRCQQSGDWLRAEIECAMAYQRIIIPLLTSNLSLNDVRPFLTGKLESLVHYQALNVPHDYFEAAMDRLRTRYLKPVDVPVRKIPAEDLRIIQSKLSQMAALPAVTRHELTAQEWFEKALGCFLKGDAIGAIQHYLEALALNPHFAEAHCGLGLAYRELGDAPGAVESFKQALRLQPNHPLADEMVKFIAHPRSERKSAPHTSRHSRA